MNDLSERIAEQAARLAQHAGVRWEDVRAVVSPYRVCPIGAHVDHQGGPVLGMAIDVYTLLAFAPVATAEVRLASENFPGEVVFDLTAQHDSADSAAPPRGAEADSAAPPRGAEDWGRYARGAAWALAGRLPDRPRGLVGRIAGALPGGGLSSSASVLLAYLSALAVANDLALAPEELVALSRRAENDFVGLASGILDPASIVGSRRGHLLAIDTRAERWEAIAPGPGAPAYRLLVAFTGIPRSLTGTGFNDRVKECCEAAGLLAERAGLGPVARLGELPDEVFDAHRDALPGPLRRRAEHFFGERARVRRGGEAWRRGDLAGFGEIMNQSCASSISRYEVGSPELVRLQEILLAIPGVFGARFSGGGYGGCAIALVAREGAEEACERAERAFIAAFPRLAGRAHFFLAESEDGLRLR